MAFETIKIQPNKFRIENNIIIGEEIPIIDRSDIGQIIIDALKKNSNHVAQIDAETNEQVTFANMLDQSIRCALWLRKQNIGKNDVVATSNNDHLNAYIPMLATFYEGAVYNPWYHEITLVTARSFMKLIQPKIMFCIESIIDVLLEAAKLENVETKFIIFGKRSGILSLNDILSTQSNKEVLNYEPKIIDNIKETAAFILFSSGTTGSQKGVMHSYETLLKIIFPYNVFPVINSKILIYTVTCWVSHISFTLKIILNNVTRIIHENFDPNVTSRIIEKHKVDFVYLLPMMIIEYCKSGVLTSKKYTSKSVKILQTSGTSLSKDIMQEFNNSIPHVLVKICYGCTEFAAPVTAQNSFSKILESSGFILPNFQIKIVDQSTGEKLGPNKIGIVYIKSVVNMLGFYKNSDAANELFDNEGFLDTGDLAFYNENGEIIICGRTKYIIKYKVNQVSPTEIEDFIIKHPDILDIAVVPVPHKLDIEWPMAFVSKIPGSKVTEKDIVELSTQLGNHSTLRAGIKFLDKLPRTPSGKIKRNELIEMAKKYAL